MPLNLNDCWLHLPLQSVHMHLCGTGVGGVETSLYIFNHVLSQMDELATRPYDIIRTLCHTDEFVTHPYDLVTDAVSYGRLTNRTAIIIITM